MAEPKGASEARRLAVNPFGDKYPDDDKTKDIVLQADGDMKTSNPDDRHVLLRWLNGQDKETGTRYTQIIHLTGQAGNYQFYPEQVKMQSEESLKKNEFHKLGSYNRAQRDQIVALAKAVEFNPKSRVNNCQTWMRDLLLAMVNDKLLPSETFEEVDKEVPLKKRVSEDTK